METNPAGEVVKSMVIRKSSQDKGDISIVPLTGGFGNQLFQFAFGLYLEEQTGRKTFFDEFIGRPRKTGQSVSIMGISTSNYLAAYWRRQPRLMRKLYTRAFGWNLSKFLTIKNPNVYFQMMKNLSRILLAIRVRRRINVFTATNLGFDSSLDVYKPGMYIGYFQTSIYASSPGTLDKLNQIRPIKLSKGYSILLDEINNTRPLLLHVRLTDYLQEEKFGVPNVRYYQESFDCLSRMKDFSNVWVFSDDLKGAKELLENFKSNLELTLFNQEDLTDIEVWSLMRYFNGYIIANSSFSWWGAFLRMDKSAPVCVPKPWFKGMRDPNLLIPADWIQVESA